MRSFLEAVLILRCLALCKTTRFFPDLLGRKKKTIYSGYAELGFRSFAFANNLTKWEACGEGPRASADST